MKLLVEELEDLSIKIKEAKERIVKLDKQYKKFFDRDLRKEIESEKKKLEELKLKLRRILYGNIEELKLIKLNFNRFYKEMEKDPFLSASLRRVGWLLDFKKLSEQEAAEKLEEIRNKRMELRNARIETIKFAKVKYKELKKYKILEKILKKKPRRDELLKWIKEENNSLKKQGWLIILNDFFIIPYIQKHMKEYREMLFNEKIAMDSYKEAEQAGSTLESEVSKELENARKTRINAEKKCRHMLCANPGFLRKLKTSRRVTTIFSNFDYNFIDSIELKHIKEDEWKKQMKKLLG